MAILTVENVVKQYGRETALNGVSFAVEPGRIVGLLGPNGSGKTTLMKIVTGLIQDYTGTVEIGGNRVGRASKAMVSYLPDRDFLPGWIRARQAVRMYEDFYPDFDRPRAEAILSQIGVDSGKRVKALSKGMREKLMLALTIARRAKLYVLDEPIAGVDPAAREYILNTILENHAQDGAILISTHSILEVETVLHDCVFLKNGGVLRAGSAGEIRADTGKSLDEWFREEYRC